MAAVSKRPVFYDPEHKRYAVWNGVKYPVIYRSGIHWLGAKSRYLETNGDSWKEWDHEFAEAADKCGAVLIEGDRGIDSLVKSVRAGFADGINLELLEMLHTFS